jgi:hypothetical protein
VAFGIGTLEDGIEREPHLGGTLARRDSAGKLVRSEKTCVSEGESPSSLEARLPEFGTKVKNGKV